MAADLSDIELLRRLVAFDTTSHLPTRPLGDFVCEYLARPGVRIDRFDCGDGQENILVALGPDSTAGEGLLLCGHVDTVPADEPGWSSDPRVLTERDGRLIARGACDMKGFVALAVNAVRERAERPPTEPLQLLLTCNEEIGTVGAAAFARSWPRDRALPRRTLIGEPTSMRVVRGHKGHLSLTITVPGVAAHSGFPQKGVNAIERAAAIVSALGVLREELAAERGAESSLFPEVPFPVLNVARIRGGSAINVIPAECEIDVGVRLLPGASTEEFLARMERAVRAARPTCEVAVAVLNDTPAFALASDHAWLAEMQAMTGGGAAVGVGFGTDAGRLAQLGLACVVWGPGDISNAHRADEWISIGELQEASRLLRRLIR